jgi:hypothetical protein
MLRIKRRHLIGILVAVGLLGAGALVQVVGQSKVSPEAIASSVTRTPELAYQRRPPGSAGEAQQFDV